MSFIVAQDIDVRRIARMQYIVVIVFLVIEKIIQYMIIKLYFIFLFYLLILY